MHCPNCNERNPESNSFCSRCGTALRGESPEGRKKTKGSDAPAETQSEAVSAIAVEKPRPATPALIDWFKETADLAYGQMVIITARWMLVGAGFILTLWNPDAIGELRVQIALILALAGANFFLHSQVLMKRPVLVPVVYAASAADIVVISLIVIAAGGFETGLFVFYFPAVLAFSVAFRTEMTAIYATAAIAIYGLISVAGVSGDDGATLVTRMAMLAAVAVCGNIYYRNERDRRRAADEMRESLKAQVQEGLPAG